MVKEKRKKNERSHASVRRLQLRSEKGSRAGWGETEMCKVLEAGWRNCWKEEGVINSIFWPWHHSCKFSDLGLQVKGEISSVVSYNKIVQFSCNFCFMMWESQWHLTEIITVTLKFLIMKYVFKALALLIWSAKPSHQVSVYCIWPRRERKASVSTPHKVGETVKSYRCLESQHSSHLKLLRWRPYYILHRTAREISQRNCFKRF